MRDTDDRDERWTRPLYFRDLSKRDRWALTTSDAAAIMAGYATETSSEYAP